jgi:sn-glycerol 3-phosphate transport system permease protein
MRAPTEDEDRLAATAATRRRRRGGVLTHALLLLGVLAVVFPIWIALVGSTHDASTIGRGDVPLLPGAEAVENYATALTGGAGRFRSSPAALMLWNSALMALLIACGKIAISLLSAYAVAFFSFPGRMVAFWTIFLTLMLPVEVRIIPTYQVIVDLDLFDSMAGLTVPLLFRQFFLTVPDEVVEAAKIDGAGPLRFFRDILLPLSVTNIAALFVILFIYGWNQYLWPLLVVSDRSLETVVLGLTRMIGNGDAQNEWNVIMATAVLALLPPVAVVVAMQRWFVRGLTETEK